MSFQWPAGFPQIPEDDWASQPVAELAAKYDTVESHGWYENLNRSVEQLLDYSGEDRLVMDYSGGTGILEDRLFRACPEWKAGVLLVDSSPKFLRVALEKFRDDSRIGLRWIRYRKAEKRLETLEEVLEPVIRERGADAIVSTNAIHLYYDLSITLKSWADFLRPGGRVFVQSGNILNPAAAENEWIIDLTVDAIHHQAMEIVAEKDEYDAIRPLLLDDDRMKAADRTRKKYFLPVRPLEFYLTSLKEAGLSIEQVENVTIPAKVSEWYDFLAVYHEGVLGWVDEVPVRLELMREAMQTLFEGRESFDCCWTYITCVRK